MNHLEVPWASYFEQFRANAPARCTKCGYFGGFLSLKVEDDDERFALSCPHCDAWLWQCCYPSRYEVERYAQIGDPNAIKMAKDIGMTIGPPEVGSWAWFILVEERVDARAEREEEEARVWVEAQLKRIVASTQPGSAEFVERMIVIGKPMVTFMVRRYMEREIPKLEAQWAEEKRARAERRKERRKARRQERKSP